jgi:hypothetical protein
MQSDRKDGCVHTNYWNAQCNQSWKVEAVSVIAVVVVRQQLAAVTCVLGAISVSVLDANYYY